MKIIIAFQCMHVVEVNEMDDGRTQLIMGRPTLLTQVGFADPQPVPREAQEDYKTIAVTEVLARCLEAERKKGADILPVISPPAERPS